MKYKELEHGQPFEFAEGDLKGRRFILMVFEQVRALVEILDTGRARSPAIDEYLSDTYDPSFFVLYQNEQSAPVASNVEVVPLVLVTRYPSEASS